VLLAHPNDIPVFQEKSNHINHLLAPENPFDQVLDPPQIIHLHQRYQEANDPANPRWKIPASEWSRVLQRIEQGETLRQIAREYGVSYEAVRRIVRAARSQSGNGEA
jgi:DNA-binding NarL/FixJ family response regulator